MLEKFIDELEATWKLVSDELQRLRDENAQLRAKLEDLVAELEEGKGSALKDDRGLQRFELERKELLSRVRKVRELLLSLEKPES